MIQLHPKETFTIVRQIEDHTDSSTYYVQAVVRNAKTDALLATINLDDKGDRRFSKTYIVPADPSGEGVWISILTSVYTDSGYTTKSGSYADKMESYLVQARPVFNPNYPTPTGPDIDYSRIDKIVAKHISKTLEDKVLPAELLTISEVIGNLKTSLKPVFDFVKNYKPNETKVDFVPVVSAISNLENKINNIEKPEKFKYELISEINSNLVADVRKSILVSEQQKAELIDVVKKAIGEEKDMLEDKLFKFVMVLKSDKPEKDDKEEPEDDLDANKKRINRLMQKT